jgi:hypothetical protein
MRASLVTESPFQNAFWKAVQHRFSLDNQRQSRAYFRRLYRKLYRAFYYIQKRVQLNLLPGNLSRGIPPHTCAQTSVCVSPLPASQAQQHVPRSFAAFLHWRCTHLCTFPKAKRSAVRLPTVSRHKKPLPLLGSTRQTRQDMECIALKRNFDLHRTRETRREGEHSGTRQWSRVVHAYVVLLLGLVDGTKSPIPGNQIQYRG